MALHKGDFQLTFLGRACIIVFPTTGNVGSRTFVSEKHTMSTPACQKGIPNMLYLDPQRSVDARVRDLLGRMTLEEKIRQMGYADCAQFAKNGKFSPELAKKFFKSLGIGGLQDPRMAPRVT